MQKDDYTLIEKYLQGELNEEEANAFRLRLQEDTALAEEYTLRKSMAIFLEKDRNQASLQPQLEALGKTYFVEEKKAKVIPFYRNRLFIGLASAAAIALLLIFWNPFQSRSLYDQYAFHQPISLTEKSTGTDLAAKADKQILWTWLQLNF